MYSVYCIEFPNGKRYIGITRLKPEARWGDGKKYKTCVLVNRAIEKYGWKNVTHLVIDQAETKEEAEAKEKYYIAAYKTTDKEFGYNILAGGDVSTCELTDEMRAKLGSGWRGKTRSQEEKDKISAGVKKTFNRAESNGHRGLSASAETKNKMSESQKARWDDEKRMVASERLRERMADPEYKERIISNLSKYKRKKGEYSVSDETKAKISEYNKGRWLGDKSPSSKPVLQFSKDGELIKRWANAGEAERAGIGLRSNIGKCCRGSKSVKTVGGYVWRYETA